MRSGWGALRGTGPRTTVRTECLSPHRSAGACPPRSLPHPGHPANPGHPASDARDIKVLSDLFPVLRLRSIDIQVLSDLEPSFGCLPLRGGLSLARVQLSEAGCPGVSGFAGWGGLGMRRKGLEDLHVYRHQQEREAKVREDLNMQRRLRCLARDRPSHYGNRGALFFVVREPVLRDRALILAILINPGHPASDVIAIKDLRTFSPYCAYVL